MSSFTTHASLTSSATLDFTLGTSQVVGCNYGTVPPCNTSAYNSTDIVGSYFAIDSNANDLMTPNEKHPIESFNGIHIGSIQSASGSHSGPIDGSENPNIDKPFEFFGNTGMHQTTSPITDLTGSGSTRVLDFSGWSWLWDGTENIPLVATSPTTIVCDTSSCSDGSNYTIDGAFHINGAAFTSVSYVLHLEGTVSSVPIPASAWLFGSGLAGLAGVARRRRKIRS
ncbi:MAG TPA: VPLPA-CTERM sorting domain-containing protein [Gammaproteobacteria bacterium]|nr:VPLPA-CTERM sorting domain-containing protein [Gammaproteobacteria bacterium]